MSKTAGTVFFPRTVRMVRLAAFSRVADSTVSAPVYCTEPIRAHEVAGPLQVHCAPVGARSSAARRPRRSLDAPRAQHSRHTRPPSRGPPSATATRDPRPRSLVHVHLLTRPARKFSDQLRFAPG